jgi:hypothetical protein
MKNLTITIYLILAVILGGMGTSWGGDVDKGLAAYESGDFATALQEWVPLAEQGDAGAQFMLGAMYEKGDGVPQDSQISVKWYTLAAEQGHHPAQTNLGTMYRKGDGVPQDYEIAVKWYTLAAEQGNAAAQTLLGFMYAVGHGVIQNNVHAHMWWSIAATNGYEEAGGLRDKVAKEMTLDQIEKSQELALDCVLKEYKGC